MRVKDIPEIAQLSAPEKILLIEELWDSIAVDQSSVPVLSSHIEELKRRLKSYESKPGNLLSLEELQASVKKSK